MPCFCTCGRAIDCGETKCFYCQEKEVKKPKVEAASKEQAALPVN